MVAQVSLRKSIVFLVYWPITAREVERFGFEYLRKQGFNVEVFDLSQLLNREALLRSPLESAINNDFICKIDLYQLLDSKIKQAAANSIFIDYIMGLAEIDLKTERIYRILRKYGAKYYVISAGALPIPLLPDKVTGLIKMLLWKAKRASNLKVLINFLIRKTIYFLRKYANLYPLPNRIFSGDSVVLEQFIHRYNISPHCVVRIHSLDYDIFLNYLRINSKVQANEKFCVFLDEAATHHPDFAILNIEPISTKEYFLSINKLFDKIEKETGLKVVVAAHPRSKYEDMPGVFGDREIVKGKTIELVANSCMVVMHSSTSVSYAVLFNKPILITKTSDMIKKGFSNFIDIMAKALGLKAINIDDNESLSRLTFNYKEWPNAQYEDYKFKYIKSKNVEDLTVWEIVAKEIKKMDLVDAEPKKAVDGH